jgi:hypothetical protein
MAAVVREAHAGFRNVERGPTEKRGGAFRAPMGTTVALTSVAAIDDSVRFQLRQIWIRVPESPT